MQLDNENPNLKQSSITLHAHGDGTYHSETGGYPGKRTEHPTIGHALMHIASLHSESDHMHIHAHDDGFTTHHVKEGGKPKGPHEHKTLSALKRHIADVMDDEGAED